MPYDFGGLLPRARAARAGRSTHHDVGRGREDSERERIDEVLQSASQPLTPDEQTSMRGRLGHDFSRVRVHRSSQAETAARDLDAAAFTVGRHVVLGAESHALAPPERDLMLAHELSHVVQQGFASVDAQTQVDISANNTAHEADADAAATGGVADLSESVRVRTAEPRVQRFELWRNVLGLFAGESFPEADLHAYLKILRDTGKIEDITDSDNKARAIVRAWREGNSPYVITPTLMTLMIKEMQSGATLDDDEQMILELLERAENHHLDEVFGTDGVNLKTLIGDFHGEEEKRLFDFFERRFVGGLAAMRSGTVKPKGRAVPLGVALGGEAPATGMRDNVPEPTCSVATPEHCHSYEGWIRQFLTLTQVGKSELGQRVIGLDPKEAKRPDQATRTDIDADQDKRRPPRLHGKSYTKEDHFIDGPTEKWVRDNLSPHLVEIAYQLPTDCADIAVVLRHVWLAAHRRTEKYRGWLIGAALADSRSKEIQKLLRGKVWSGSVARIVKSHAGADGKALRSWDDLEPLLRPGDVLVWDHTAAGQTGHTQTILQIRRNSAERITHIEVLQGNQPISPGTAEALVDRHRDQKLSVKRLGAAPGRRIERGDLSGRYLRNVNGIWTWPDNQTVIVAAGPPVSAGRPAARKGRKGTDIVRGLEDWVGEMTSAPSTQQLLSRFEAALLETRSRIETSKPAGQTSAEAFGTAAGERLWKLANSSARDRAKIAAELKKSRRAGMKLTDAELLAEDMAASSHYWPLLHMTKMLDELAKSSKEKEQTRRLFARISAALSRSARGATSITFDRTVAKGTEVANVLVAGFDPFAGKVVTGATGNDEWVQTAPTRGRVNPSGAAVLQLDGETVPIEDGKKAAVEGVIMPVSYADFRAGVVESTLAPHSKDLDAIITVSLDGNLGPGGRTQMSSQKPSPPDPLRVERFAVGVHELTHSTKAHPLHPNRLEAIPGLPGSGQLGPAIIEARGAQDIGKAAGLKASAAEKASGKVDEVTEGRDVTFEFSSDTEAKRARAALGLATRGTAESKRLVVTDVAAVQAIVATMERGIGGVGITFRAGTETFQTKVLDGPGGNFLSNELSYRALRFLAAGGGRPGAASFHVHTQRVTEKANGTLPLAVGETKDRLKRRKALDLARDVIQRLVSNLKKLIAAAAGSVLAGRKKAVKP